MSNSLLFSRIAESIWSTFCVPSDHFNGPSVSNASVWNRQIIYAIEVELEAVAVQRLRAVQIPDYLRTGVSFDGTLESNNKGDTYLILSGSILDYIVEF